MAEVYPSNVLALSLLDLSAQYRSTAVSNSIFLLQSVAKSQTGLFASSPPVLWDFDNLTPQLASRQSQPESLEAEWETSLRGVSRRPQWQSR